MFPLFSGIAGAKVAAASVDDVNRLHADIQNAVFFNDLRPHFTVYFLRQNSDG